ncbi:class I SAM-dependent methyltransferase [Methanofollis fontis]|uniref:Methyltransferase domain-containing protein n=1 Tax=Methanofollis fontis TaxID=2052832 RepID=A0A483CNY0_9EURY|nr:class I SAM-dependent methyltransferase [Methanofollis fontis]TAJ43808.1 hypothetical protein CUJ86_06995 [Methanofollis fontis]
MKEYENMEERKAVLGLAGVNDKEILDIGAGPLAILAAQEYECFVTSVDIDTVKLREFEAEAEAAGVGEKISFEEGDASDLPYCKDAFDIGICFGALHHVPGDLREQVIRELARVSYERFVVAEYTPEGFQEIHGGDERYSPVDLSDLESLLAGAGKVAIHRLDSMVVYVIDRR